MREQSLRCEGAVIYTESQGPECKNEYLNNNNNFSWMYKTNCLVCAALQPWAHWGSLACRSLPRGKPVAVSTVGAGERDIPAGRHGPGGAGGTVSPAHGTQPGQGSTWVLSFLPTSKHCEAPGSASHVPDFPCPGRITEPQAGLG